MNKVESIKEQINLTNMMVADAYTFLKIRVERKSYIGEDLGGGNFLIALGLFSALGYLAKIYVLLTGKYALPDIEGITKAKEHLNAVVDSNLKEYFMIKRPDQINERDAFSKLLSDPDCPHNLGASKEAYSNIYHDVRDHLAHRLKPNFGYTMVAMQTDEGHEIEFGKIKQAIESSNNKVMDESGNLYVDFLGRDIKRISSWLIKKIDNDEFKEKDIEITHKWLEQLS